MDPLSQAVLGASTTQFASKPYTQRQHLLKVGMIGALAGMAADLDVLIFSPYDPLLFLAYHRHFTHALVFIPIGALIVSWMLHRLYFRHRLQFKHTYLSCLIGYATHGLLDACTTYGTSLFWPFSDVRVAWNIISVIDPLITLPALALTILAGRRKSRLLAGCALGWMLFCIGIGFIQHQRAESAALALAKNRNHSAERIEVKPTFANLLLWRSIYQHDGYYYVDGVRAGIQVSAWSGQCVPVFQRDRDISWLDSNSQQAKDIERFRFFTNDYLIPWGDDQNTVADIRYSSLPHVIEPLWGIKLTPEKTPDQHVDYWISRNYTNRLNVLLSLLAGNNPEGWDCKRL